MSFPGCSGDKVIRKNVLLLSDLMMMVKVPLICFFSGYVVLVYSVFLHTSFFGLVISATVFGHFKLFCIFYKVHAKNLTYLFLPAKQDRNASYFMWYIFLFIYPHDASCFFFLNSILNFYQAHGLLQALIPLWGRCCLAVYLLCCRRAAGFDKVQKVALAPEKLFCYFSDHFSNLTEWFQPCYPVYLQCWLLMISRFKRVLCSVL